MTRRDLENNIGVVNLLDPQDVVKTDTPSNILDTAGFDAAAIVVQSEPLPALMALAMI